MMMGGPPQQPQQQQQHQQMFSLQNEQQVVRRAGRQAIRQFLEQHTCYAVLRASGKVVVFDTRIPIQLAFYALVEHDMLAAPLWDPVACQFVGLLTVTDFIAILRHYKETGKDVANLAVDSIATLLAPPTMPPSISSGSSGNNRITATSTDGGNSTQSAEESKIPEEGGGGQPSSTTTAVRMRPFLGADASCSLHQACRQLYDSKQDFLPICYTEDMRVLACITFTNILEHLVTHFREQRRLFDDSIADLGIGTYGNALVVVHPGDTLSHALALMQQHHLSALPVVDPTTYKLMGVYSLADITFLTKATDAHDAVRNLELPLQDVLAQARSDVTTPDALRTCSPQFSLQAIFESFGQWRFNRLYVVDPNSERLLGVVSARDLVAYFLVTPDDA